MSEGQQSLAMRPTTEMVSTDIYSDAAAFTHLLRVGKMFASSPLVPEHLRKGGPEQAVANCTICLSMARELGENPIVVMQNIHFVSGKFGWSSSYMIARANRSGKFKAPISWRISGKGDSLRAEAFATLPDGQEVSFACDMAMARAEGWTKNPKYQTMPEVMLRYRSAAFLVRFYAPEVMLGYHTADELEDTTVAQAPVKLTAVQVPAPETEPETVPEPEPPAPLSPLLEEVVAGIEVWPDRHQGIVPDWMPSEAKASQMSDSELNALLDRMVQEG